MSLLDEAVWIRVRFISSGWSRSMFELHSSFLDVKTIYPACQPSQKRASRDEVEPNPPLSPRNQMSSASAAAAAATAAAASTPRPNVFTRDSQAPTPSINGTEAKDEDGWSEDDVEEDDGDGEVGDASSHKRKRQRTGRPLSVSCERCKERKVSRSCVIGDEHVRWWWPRLTSRRR